MKKGDFFVWGHIENFCSVMSLMSAAMGHIAFFLAYMSRETKEKGHRE